MSADILLFALIAAGLIFWLRNVLGTEIDDDTEQGSSIFDDKTKEKRESMIRAYSEEENTVISLSNSIQSKFNLPRYASIENKTTENALEDFIKTNENLNLGNFVEGARSAFAMIVESFAEGDRETLKDLLSEKVYSAFDKTILEREKRQESVSTNIHAVRKVDISRS